MNTFILVSLPYCLQRSECFMEVISVGQGDYLGGCCSHSGKMKGA